MVLLPSLAFAQDGESAAPPNMVAGAEAEAATAVDPPPAVPADVGAFSAETVLQGHGLRGFSPAVAGHLLRSADGGPIALTTLALPHRDAGRVSVWVEIDGPTFLGGRTEGRRQRGEIYVYALGAAGSVAGHFAEAFAVDLERIGEAVYQSGLKLRGELTLPPGDYRLRVLVRNQSTESLGLLTRKLVVPPAESAPKIAITFATPPDRDAWIPIHSWTLRSADPGSAVEGNLDPDLLNPSDLNPSDLNPSVLPVLTAGEPARARVFGGSNLAPGAALEIRLVAADSPAAQAQSAAETATGASSDSVEVAATDPIAGQGTLEEAGLATFTVPKVETGVYRLSLRFGSNAAWTPEIPVLVLADAERERSLQWTDLRWRLQESGDPTAAGGSSRLALSGGDDREKGGRRAERRRNRRQTQEIASRYRQALATLAEDSRSGAPAGAPGGALEALFALESSALGGGVGLLSSGEFAAAEELAAEDPAILLPLIVLHQRLYRRYQGRRAYSLGSHSRLMVERLTEHYVASGGDLTVAADSLAALGGVLIGARLPSSGSRLLQRARELDPGHPVALLGLAALFERFGSYGQARSLLSELVEAHPQHLEGRLRLAINLQRTSDRTRAAELLASIDQPSEEPWIWSLARQEEARLLLRRDRTDQALALLTEAHRQAPRDSALTLLLAHVHDRIGNSSQAQELVATLRPSRRAESPRMRYDRPPREAFRLANEALRAAAKNARPLLFAALGGRPEAG